MRYFLYKKETNKLNKEELKKFGYAGSIHSHTHYSNIRFYDATIRVPDAYNRAKELGYKIVAFTDHGNISSHMEAAKYYSDHKDQLGNIKPLLGTETYLIHQNEFDKAKEDNDKFKFNHFLLNALNKHGHEFMRKISSKSWEHFQMYHGQERVYNTYQEIEEMMKGYKGDVIASSACLASPSSQYLLKYKETKDKKWLDKVVEFVKWGIKVFGKENFFLELMPSDNPEQLYVNNMLVKLSKKSRLKIIITTDAHYLSPKERPIHEALLHARQPDRDLSAYDTTYMMSTEDLFHYFSDDVLTESFKNIESIYDRIEAYDFEHAPIIPETFIPGFKKADISWIDTNKYPYFLKFENSKRKVDQYYLSKIMEGIEKTKIPKNDVYLSRINLEFGELWEISKKLNQPMSAYFTTLQQLLESIQKIALINYGRGSSACWITNFILGLTHVDSIKYNLPYYRFLSKERVTRNTAGDFPDEDIDTEANKRDKVLKEIKKQRGDKHVLNFCTFNTIGVRSSVLIACRGLGVDNNEANYIVDLLPSENGKEWPLHDAFFGNKEKGRKPSSKLIKEVNKYPKLKETVIGLFGLVVGRSIHASGVYISNEDYIAHNAMMKAKNGIEITQFDADMSERASALKYDFLSLSALDRVRSAFDLLIKDKKIEWQGDLGSTYWKYFGPNKLDYTSPKMYNMLFDGTVINAFQYDSETGWKALRKANVRKFMDLVSINGALRLRSDEGEQPLDKYIRYRDHPEQWENEMIKSGLSDSERKTLHALLDESRGICLSQETLMKLSMNSNISNFDLLQANKLRKAIAKKDPKKQAEQHEIFMKQGLANGSRKKFLDYVWENCVMIQKG